jgi:type I restriction enzyme S subunit
MEKETKFKQTEIGMIPEDWEVETAENYCKRVTDGTHASAKKRSKGKYLITSKHLKQNRLDFDNAYFISEEDYDEVNKRSKVEQFDILFSMIGTVGEIYQEKSNKIDYAIKNVGLFKFDVHKNKSYWFLYWLKSDIAQEYIQSRQAGSTQQYLTLEALRKFPVAFPRNPREQSAIAAILSSLDDKIELNRKMNKTLEEIGQAIFKHWFVDFEFPNEEGKPYKSSGGEMVYNEELGKEIPKGWRVGYLGDKISSNTLNSGIYRFEGEKIYLDTASVQGTEIIELNTKIIFEQRPSRANLQPKPSTVWFAKMKDSKKILYFDDYSEYAIRNFILSTGFAGLNVEKYALYYILSFISRDEFELEKDNLCNGTTMQAINNENIAKIKLLSPPKDILEKFNNIIKPIYKKSYNNWLQNLSLSQIRDLLLPKLMSGKIKVPLEVGT